MANTHDTTNTTNMFYDFFVLAWLHTLCNQKIMKLFQNIPAIKYIMSCYFN